VALRASGWAAPGLGAEAVAGRAEPSPQLPHPLSGVRVVEASTWFASAYANRLLSDLGADVVKLEAPGGDPMRPLPDPFEGSERGKRDLALDLKGPGAADVVRRLFAAASVVQHNLRPGTAERIGVDYATARAANPSVVYTYSPGYGSEGPKAGLQSFAPLLSGFVGIFHEAAGPGNDPHATFGNEDYYNGLLTACASLLGLVRRERTGDGGFVECPQLHSAVLATSAWYRHAGGARSVRGVLDGDQTGMSPGWGIHQCLVGWLAVACAEPRQLEALISTVVAAPSSPSDATVPGDGLADRLRHHFVEDTAEGWSDRLAAAGVPCEVVREHSWMEELFHDPFLVAAGTVCEDEHPTYGRIREIADLVHLRRRPGPRRGRSPLLGEHSRAVLAELGIGPDGIDRLVADGTVVAAGKGTVPVPAGSGTGGGAT
jgi:crotonobetainyl-CoA:carnitine CoA-transferase CaiB-like acyl-CoA transferase